VSANAALLASMTVTSAYQCRLFCTRRMSCIGYNYKAVASVLGSCFAKIRFRQSNSVWELRFHRIMNDKWKNLVRARFRVTGTCELLSVSFRQPANVTLVNGSAQMWYTLYNATNWETGARIGWIGLEWYCFIVSCHFPWLAARPNYIYLLNTSTPVLSERHPL
jgi:hypothetical protein